MRSVSRWARRVALGGGWRGGVIEGVGHGVFLWAVW